MEPTWGRQLLLVSGYQSFFPLLSDSLFYVIFHLSPRTLVSNSFVGNSYSDVCFADPIDVCFADPIDF